MTATNAAVLAPVDSMTASELLEPVTDQVTGREIGFPATEVATLLRLIILLVVGAVVLGVKVMVLTPLPKAEKSCSNMV